jgi:hypothetical protein
MACLSQRNSPARNLIEEIQLTAATLREVARHTNGQAEACNSFSTSTKLNNWGKIFLQAIRNAPNPALYEGSKDILKLCPNYRSMSDEEKNGLQLMFIKNFSMSEASCKATARLPQARNGNFGAPNGTAYGLFQMHLGKENLLTPKTHACKPYDSQVPEKAIRCLAAHLNERVAEGYPIFTRNHFADLDPNDSRGEARRNMADIRNYRYCKVSYNAGINTAKN